MGVAAIGAPVTLIAGLTAAVRIGAEFEKTMSDVGAFVGGASDRMTELSDKAEELGRSTAFTNSDAATAMVELGKAGFDAEKVLGSIDGVLTLAAAGGVEMGEAATIAAAALNQFRLPAEDMGRVVDVLAKGASSGAISLSELGNQFTFAAAGAADVGMGIEDVSATLATLATVVGADKAGSTLAGITAKMSKPTEAASKELDRLGLSFTTAEGAFKGLPQILDEFNLALTDATAEDKAKALNTIFEMRSARGFSQLLKQGGNALRDTIAIVKDSEGFGLEVATKKLDNVAGGFEKVKSAASGLATDFFQIFGSDLQASLEWVADFIANDLTSAMSEFKKSIDGLAQLWVDVFDEPAAAFERLRRNFVTLVSGDLQGIEGASRASEVIEHITEKNVTGEGDAAQRAEKWAEQAAGIFGRTSGVIANDLDIIGDMIEQNKPAVDGLQMLDIDPPAALPPPDTKDDTQSETTSRNPLNVALKGSRDAFDIVNKAIKGGKDAHQKTIAKESEKQTKLLQKTVDLIDGLPDSMPQMSEVMSIA